MYSCPSTSTTQIVVGWRGVPSLRVGDVDLAGGRECRELCGRGGGHAVLNAVWLCSEVGTDGGATLAMAGVVRSRAVKAARAATAAAIRRLRRSPWARPAGWASSAPKTAMARAPPSCLLVLNAPLAVPAMASGTLLR